MSNKRKIKVKKKEEKEKVDDLTLMIRESLGSMGRSVNPYQEKMLVNLYKMFIVGGVSTIIDLVIYVVLSLVTKFNPMIINSISFAVAFIYSIIMSFKYSFSGKDKKKLTSFLILSLSGFVLTEGILFGLCHLLDWNSILVKVLAIILVIVFKVLMNKFVFKEKK